MTVTAADRAAYSRRLGEVAYNAYCERTNWRSLISGAQLPPYHELKDEIQRAWSASAIAVAVFATNDVENKRSAL